MNLGGQLVVASGELSVTDEVGASHVLGWECGVPAADCHSIEETTAINKLTPKADVFDLTNGMRVVLSGQFFVVVGFDAVFFTQYEASILEARIGPMQAIAMGYICYRKYFPPSVMYRRLFPYIYKYSCIYKKNVLYMMI